MHILCLFFTALLYQICKNYFYAGKKEEYYEKASLCVAGFNADLRVR